jgi:hypothetical protein
MVQKEKLKNSEIVHIPIMEPTISGVTSGIAEYAKRAPEILTWEIIDMRILEIQGKYELLIVFTN